MYLNNSLLMAVNDQPQYMSLKMASRHGLITGATGTGKTVTVKVMAESFSDAGVPVFLADVKGDLSGMSQPGEQKQDIIDRANNMGLSQCGWTFSSYPTVYWDVFAKKGIPVRATISEMGPLLLSRLMDLTPVQEGVLNIVFRIADDQGLLLLDIKDLRAVVQAVGDHASDYRTTYGNIAGSSIGAIQRGLLKLESQGAAQFFGEPALDIRDWIRCDQTGKGIINVLNCEELFQKPDLYAAFLLWMLSELYETLPEVGDLDKPKMVFFFDEAHLLFKLKSKELMEKVELVIRLIRSKGVGVYFITQNPADVPDAVLSQLGNKIQHALRAYTPSDQKSVRAAAQSFVVNPAFDTEDTIPQLGKGEALVSFLDEKGAPQMVQRAFILPPQSKMGSIDEGSLAYLITNCDMYQKYSQSIDRESAYELLNSIMPAAQTLQGIQYTAPDFGQNQGQPQMNAVNFNQPNVFAQQPVQTASTEWTCTACGSVNNGKFCGNCGSPKDVSNAQPAVNNMFSQPVQNAGYSQPVQVNYNTPAYTQQNMTQAYQQVSFSQPSTGYIQSSGYNGPSLVAAVQAQQLQQSSQSQMMTQAQIEKIQADALKQAKAELKAEQKAEKASKKQESDLSKATKSIATSGARTAVNYLVRGALGSLLKK